MRLRTLAASAVAFALGLAAPVAPAQPLSGKSIRLIVPFPAGGPTDIVARPLAQLLGETLEASFFIENRGGAGGSVGAEALAKSPADGLTLMVGTVGTHAINGSLYRKLGYDPVRDFTPVALVAAAPVALVVAPATAADSVTSLLAYAKRAPTPPTFGTAGNGTPGHLTGVMFKAATGAELSHIPYRGSAPAVTDLLGGQINLMFDPLQSVLPHVQAGKLRAIAVSSRERAGVLPNVPTIAESGVPGFETTAWWAVFAPRGLPVPLTTQLAAAAEKVAPGMRDKLAPLGVNTRVLTGAAFAEFQRAEIAKWGKAVRDSGATLD